MRLRLRGIGRAVAGRIARVMAGYGDECMIVLGVGLLAVGFWRTWPPGMFFAAGVVVLWLSLPSRAPFISRADPSKHRKGA